MNPKPLGSLLLAATLAAQQAPNLLPPPAAWTVTVNPAEVAVNVVGNRIDFVSNCNHTNSPVSASVQVTVPLSSSYLLWLDAVWASAPSSLENWTWSIPGVGSGSWKQNDIVNSRDVAQWTVNLPAGSHTLTLSTTSFGCGGLGRIWAGELREVTGPVLVPDLCFVDPNQIGAAAYASLSIQNGGAVPNPIYMLFLSSSTLPTPYVWPFGDQWVANPLYLGALNTTTFTPPWGGVAQTLHGIVFRPVGSPQWWQVVQYDPTNPITTLRIGSPTRTSSLH
ncbi:MAG: hypothetical protein U1E73_06160 [Planctomycetota bacterium]